MRIYRVEDLEGEGPYGDDDSWCSTPKMFERHHRSSRTPSPDRDGMYLPLSMEVRLEGGIPRWTVTSHFGFRTLKQLRSWFTPAARRSLSECGYVISVYEAPDEYVYLGNRQLVFWLGGSKKVDERDLSEV